MYIKSSLCQVYYNFVNYTSKLEKKFFKKKEINLRKLGSVVGKKIAGGGVDRKAKGSQYIKNIKRGKLL